MRHVLTGFQKYQHRLSSIHIMVQQPQDMESTEEPNRVADTLAGKVVLITGATGFLGKVLIEKILRCCPDVDTLYLLVRPKKGRTPRQRVEDMFTSPLFDKLRGMPNGPSLLTKAVGVTGDVVETDLGLSAADRETLCRRVSIVFHGAATIRFDEPLKRAVLINARGTQLMLDLAAEMKQLEGFFHISTAYCHLKEKILQERPYPPPADPHHIISLVETIDDAQLQGMTHKLLAGLPNTYAFTKALAEGLVVEQMDRLPVCVLRPSIVIPVWLEPLPGWTDNINGPTGLLIGAGKGVIRTMFCNQDGYADYLPVDIAVNGILIATWNFVSNKDHSRSVCHLTSSSEIKISWAEIIERGRRITEHVPLNNVVWYPGGSMKRSRLMHNVCVLLFHLLPALLVDTVLFLAGHKPILLRVQRRINKGFEVFEYYANNQWDFKNDLVIELRQRLNKRERSAFKIDSDGLDIDAYFSDCIHAARLYILKEPADTLPAARRHMRLMWWVDKITKFLFWGLLLWSVVTRCGLLLSGGATSHPR